MLATLNSLDREKERLIEITEDEQITEDELADFARIQSELDRIAETVESLRIWVKRTVVSGGIDRGKLEELRKKEKSSHS